MRELRSVAERDFVRDKPPRPDRSGAMKSAGFGQTNVRLRQLRSNDFGRQSGRGSVSALRRRLLMTTIGSMGRNAPRLTLIAHQRYCSFGIPALLTV